MNNLHCVGCQEDFYNGKNDLGIEECWQLKDAKLVKKYKIGWWVSPTEDGAFEKVTVPNCFRQTGQFAYFENLPKNAVNPR